MNAGHSQGKFAAVSLGIVAFAFVSLLCVPPASAFPGAIAASTPAELDGAVIALLRDGRRTIITLEAHTTARGPIALVVPLPAPVQADAVSTLLPGALDKLDLMTSPRLVHYTERDPCAATASTLPEQLRTSERATPTVDEAALEPMPIDTADVIQPEFSVEVLPPMDASGLVSHLTLRSLTLPEELVTRLMQQQVTQRYLVAHLDVEGQATGKHKLPPIRFVLDTDALELPVVVGRRASAVPVTLHIISQGSRFELQRRPNVTIPTNLVVTEAALDSFAPFYEALSDRMHQRYPGSGLTEYAWPATCCAPCPTSALSADDLRGLGAELIPSHEDASAGPSGEPDSSYWDRFVGTRIRLELGPDEHTPLTLRATDPITGGDGVPRGEQGELSAFARRDVNTNAFQARYLVLDKWETPPTCQSPVRGVWVGPADDAPPTRTASQLAFANAESGDLNTFLETGIPEEGEEDDMYNFSGEYFREIETQSGVTRTSQSVPGVATSGAPGCGHCSVGAQRAAPIGWLMLIGVIVWRRRQT